MYLSQCVNSISASPIFRLAALLSSLFVSCVFAQNPVPQIVGPVKPQAVAPGGDNFTLTVYGANFVSGAVVNWNGQPRETEFISRRELRAKILATDIAQNTAGTISATNPGPGGGNSSASFVQLEVHHPTPTINPGSPVVLSKTHGIGYGSTVIADFNADDIPDLFGDGTVWLGDGDGSFDVGWSSLTYYPPFGATYGDFNGDGKLDLAYIGFDKSNPNNPPRNLRVMLGDGTGRFHKSWSVWDYSGWGFYWLATGDFNRDGTLDVAVVQYSKIAIFLGNGDGTFRHFVELPLATTAAVEHLFVGDFNGDGKLDLITDDQFGNVYLRVGKGDGTFRLPRFVGQPGPCSLVAANDFNADGKLDLLMGCRSSSESQFLVLLGNGDGTFQQVIANPINPANPYTIATGDFNSDGKPDVIVSNGGTALEVLIFLGNGDGTFQPQQVVNLPGGWNGEGGMMVGDFNSDGLLDLLAVSPYYIGFIYLQH
jgi:hypothetical protein